jgi:fatty acid desaturase
MSSDRRAPSAARYAHLRATDGAGALVVAACAAVWALGIYLSARVCATAWGGGEVALAIASVQWFVALHEAGHGTLFRTRRLNAVAGRLAAMMTLIPFEPWRAIHFAHHRWTGWQDVDPTTRSLVPRPLGTLERLVVNACWRWSVPLFALVYRATLFWNPRVVLRHVVTGRRRALAVADAALVVGVVALATAAFGAHAVVRTYALAWLLGLVVLEPIMLSQHTHVPLRSSRGQPVAPHPSREQEPFTRSLRFPAWFALPVLLHFDAHELHHLYPAVPGYLLRRIDYAAANEFPAWEWIRRAKRVEAETFLFKNRNDTGLSL